MDDTTQTAALLRDVARIFSRSQRINAACMDGTSTVRCHVLNEILRKPGITQQHLVETLGLDKSWISRAIDGLVQTGTVIKQADQNDRRCVNLLLTSSGIDLARQLDQKLNEHAAQILNHLTSDQNKQIEASLRLLLEKLESRTANN